MMAARGAPRVPSHSHSHHVPSHVHAGRMHPPALPRQSAPVAHFHATAARAYPMGGTIYIPESRDIPKPDGIFKGEKKVNIRDESLKISEKTKKCVEELKYLAEKSEEPLVEGKFDARYNGPAGC
jgi:hypothetical protein